VSKKPQPSTLEQPAPIDLAWLVGLLEGEGYFCILRGRSETLLIGCGMTDRDVIERLQRVSKTGHVSVEKTATKSVYRWKCSNADAYALMKMLRPHMGQRRSKMITMLIKKYERKLQQLPRYVVRHLPTECVEEPYELKAWCRERGVPLNALNETLYRERQPIDGYVREQ